MSPFVGSNILAGASGQGDASYKIERSLRFNSADSAKLTRTASAAGNRKTWTWSAWVKRASLAASDQYLFGAQGSGQFFLLGFASTHEFFINPSAGVTGATLKSNAKFRDPSAWYHIVVAVDTTQSTASNRVRVYINGDEITSWATSTYPNQNTDWHVNNNVSHSIGASTQSTGYCNVYMTDIHHVDGEQLAATDFGELDDDGVWQAKKYEGSYVTGIAETTGAKPIHNTTDNFGQVKGTGTRTDSNSSYLVLALPMDGSNGGTTFNDESANIKGSGTAKTITNAYVTTSTSSSQFYGSSGDFSANSAKLTIGSSNDFAFGTGDFTIEWWMNFNSIGGTPYDSGSVNTAGNFGIFIDSTYFYVRASGTDTYFAWSSVGVSTGEWHHYAVVRDNGTVTIYLDGVSVASGTNNANVTSTTAYVGVLTGHGYGTNGYQQDLRVYKGLAKYTSSFTVPPKASNSFHLEFEDNSSSAGLGTDTSGTNNDWTVNNISVGSSLTPSSNFDCIAYTGTGSSQNITGLGFQPDLVIVKSRSGDGPPWVDSVRGADKALFSSSSTTEGTYGSITGFLSNGFTVGGYNNANQSGVNFIAWAWKAGGSASANTDGTINSSVSVNSQYGFSIVTYQGNNTAGATVGHGLGVAPGLIIVKNRDTAYNWSVLHQSLNTTGGEVILLNSTDGKITSQAQFNSTSPTASVFSLGSGGNTNYPSGDDFVAYCFHDVDGYQKIGSYTGNGSSTGPVITTGFKPRFLLIKASSVSGNDWCVYDSVRDPANPRDTRITWNDADADTTHTNIHIDFLDNGFQPKAAGSTINTSGVTYIYWAIADDPAEGGNDSLIDTPTDYKGSGNNGGNYATLNPLTVSSSNSLVTNGNLDFDVTSGSAWSSVLGTMAFTTEKIYFETTLVKSNSSTGCNAAGAVVAVRRLANQASWHVSGNDNYSVRFTDNGCYKNGASTATNGAQASGGNVATGDVIGFAIDGTNGTFGIYRNGVVQASGSIGITGYSAGDALIPFVAGFPDGGGYTYGKFSNFNFGQRPFEQTPPAGHVSLCTQNLADPTITDGSTAFDILTWTGDGSGARTVSGLNLSDAPDFVWSKTRNHGYHNNTWDSVRGYGSSATALITDYLGSANGGKLTSATASSLTFDGGVWHNENAKSYVAWTWDAGSSNTSISAGGLNSSAYDQSQTWSGQVTGTNYSGYPKTNMFTGTVATATLPADGQTLTFTPSPSFSNAKTVKIYYYYPSSHADAWKINGTSVELTTTSGSLTHTFDVEGSGFTSIAWSRNLHGSEDTGIYAIEVDGTRLVDYGVSVKNVPTIATTVRANPNYGFSISKADVAASLTGGPTVAHGLNAKPDFIIGKNVDSLSIYWRVFHKDLPENYYLSLNRSDIEANSSAVWGDNNSLDSRVFQIGSGTPASMWIPSGTDECIFYAWSEVEGYSKFGSYTGNGNADGPFVYTGFKPKWILIRCSSATQNWVIIDGERNTFNIVNNGLYADLANAEQTSNRADFTSNGFKIRTNSGELNNNNQTHIYAAFAEHPFKSARAR